MALGVNEGVIVGAYRDANGLHGFRRDPNGAVTPIDVPNALETEARGINTQKRIVGRYTDANFISHGFRLSPEGKITTIDVPGATATVASAIDRDGRIVGHYTDADALDHGYLLKDGAFQTLDAPGGLCGTQLFTIAGHHLSHHRIRIGGSFSDCSTHHGFVSGGTLDIPGALSTMVYGIKRKLIVGDYVDVNGKSHGFKLRRSHISFRTIDFPGAVETHARGIARFSKGIVGWHVDAFGKTHGWQAFLQRPQC